MRCVLVAVVVVGVLLDGVSLASAARSHSASYWSNLAVTAARELPGCGNVTPGPPATTDAAPPKEVLSRYGIFRAPAAGPLPAVGLTAGGGLIATRSARSTTVDGVEVTVATILNWRPSVWPRSCDIATGRRLDRLLKAEPSPRVRAAARAMNRRQAAGQAQVRRLPPRTLLFIQAPALSPIGNTGALELSRLRGLYFNAVYPGTGHTFAGLIPDRVARIRFRSAGHADVEVPVVDNIVVVHLAADRIGGRGYQQVWLRADGSVIRTIGRLR